jgi:hypothetical protein
MDHCTLFERQDDHPGMVAHSPLLNIYRRSAASAQDSKQV